MNIEDDHMEFGALIPLRDGWYLDTESNTKFKIDEEGNPVDEFGLPMMNDLFGDEQEY